MSQLRSRGCSLPKSETVRRRKFAGDGTGTLPFFAFEHSAKRFAYVARSVLKHAREEVRCSLGNRLLVIFADRHKARKLAQRVLYLRIKLPVVNCPTKWFRRGRDKPPTASPSDQAIGRVLRHETGEFSQLCTLQGGLLLENLLQGSSFHFLCSQTCFFKKLT